MKVHQVNVKVRRYQLKDNKKHSCPFKCHSFNFDYTHKQATEKIDHIIRLLGKRERGSRWSMNGNVTHLTNGTRLQERRSRLCRLLRKDRSVDLHS